MFGYQIIKSSPKSGNNNIILYIYKLSNVFSYKLQIMYSEIYNTYSEDNFVWILNLNIIIKINDKIKYKLILDYDKISK